MEFSYKEKGVDQASIVRTKVREILHLLGTEQLLIEERATGRIQRERFVGISSHQSEQKTTLPDRNQDLSHLPYQPPQDKTLDRTPQPSSTPWYEEAKVNPICQPNRPYEEPQNFREIVQNKPKVDIFLEKPKLDMYNSPQAKDDLFQGTQLKTKSGSFVMPKKSQESQEYNAAYQGQLTNTQSKNDYEQKRTSQSQTAAFQAQPYSGFQNQPTQYIASNQNQAILSQNPPYQNPNAQYSQNIPYQNQQIHAHNTQYPINDHQPQQFATSFQEVKPNSNYQSAHIKSPNQSSVPNNPFQTAQSVMTQNQVPIPNNPFQTPNTQYEAQAPNISTQSLHQTAQNQFLGNTQHQIPANPHAPISNNSYQTNVYQNQVYQTPSSNPFQAAPISASNPQSSANNQPTSQNNKFDPFNLASQPLQNRASIPNNQLNPYQNQSTLSAEELLADLFAIPVQSQPQIQTRPVSAQNEKHVVQKNTYTSQLNSQNNVYSSENQFLPQNNGYTPQTQPHSQNIGHPPQNQPLQKNGYPPQNQTLPPQNTGYSPQNQSLPQYKGYTPQNNAYPPQNQSLLQNNIYRPQAQSNSQSSNHASEFIPQNNGFGIQSSGYQTQQTSQPNSFMTQSSLQNSIYTGQERQSRPQNTNSSQVRDPRSLSSNWTQAKDSRSQGREASFGPEVRQQRSENRDQNTHNRGINPSPYDTNSSRSVYLPQGPPNYSQDPFESLNQADSKNSNYFQNNAIQFNPSNLRSQSPLPYRPQQVALQRSQPSMPAYSQPINYLANPNIRAARIGENIQPFSFSSNMGNPLPPAVRTPKLYVNIENSLMNLDALSISLSGNQKLSSLNNIEL